MRLRFVKFECFRRCGHIIMWTKTYVTRFWVNDHILDALHCCRLVIVMVDMIHSMIRIGRQVLLLFATSTVYRLRHGCVRYRCKRILVLLSVKICHADRQVIVYKRSSLREFRFFRWHPLRQCNAAVISYCILHELHFSFATFLRPMCSVRFTCCVKNKKKVEISAKVSVNGAAPAIQRKRTFMVLTSRIRAGIRVILIVGAIENFENSFRFGRECGQHCVVIEIHRFHRVRVKIQ